MFGVGEAVKEMRNGNRVRRAGWNGKGMHVELATSGAFAPREAELGEAFRRPLEPFVVMWTAGKTWVPWLCSQADLLAVDWELAP